MATLAELLLMVDDNLGTSNEGYYTESKKTRALNAARKEILMKYDIEEFVTEANVSFTSGLGTKPTDYLRKFGKLGEEVRDLWQVSTEQDYRRVDIARFDDEVDYTWTEKFGSLYILPASTVTLRLRYIDNPTDMTTGSSSSFPAQLDEAHAYWATYLLLFKKQYYEAAESMRIKAEACLQTAIAQTMMDKGDVVKSNLDRAIMNSNPGDPVQYSNNLLIL